MTPRSKSISTLALVCVLTLATVWVPLPALADPGDAPVSAAAVRAPSEHSAKLWEAPAATDIAVLPESAETPAPVPETRA